MCHKFGRYNVVLDMEEPDHTISLFSCIIQQNYYVENA